MWSAARAVAGKKARVERARAKAAAARRVGRGWIIGGNCNRDGSGRPEGVCILRVTPEGWVGPAEGDLAMILLLYNLMLLAGLLVSAPWWLWRLATTEKYREGLRARLGGVPAGLLRSLDAERGRPVIWLHAVSVGEVLAVSRLVSELDGNLPEFRVMVSTTTRTGQALARERFGAGRVFYCPLDLPWATGAYLRAVRPAVLVLAETEFWPNLLAGCGRRGVPVVVVNARISDRSWPRYRAIRGLWRPILRKLTAVLAQTEVDAERLRALGVERAMVGGNLKFDVRATVEAEATRLLRVQAAGRRLLVAGSTLDGEEAMLLGAWPELMRAEPELAMVLAPRHPERFGAVAELLERVGVVWRRRSEMGGAEVAPGEIVLLDTIGELASVYGLAAVAFVGGSLVAAGGHNPLEPAQFGVPVVMGESWENFRAIVEEMVAGGGLLVVSREGLAAGIAGLLTDEHAARELGEAGKRVFEHEAGATARAVETIAEVAAERGGQ